MKNLFLAKSGKVVFIPQGLEPILACKLNILGPGKVIFVRWFSSLCSKNLNLLVSYDESKNKQFQFQFQCTIFV